MSTDKKILTNRQINISDFKRNSSNVVKAAADEIVVVLKFGEPEFYMVPAKKYERIINHIDSLEIAIDKMNILIDSCDNTKSATIEKE